VQDTFTTKHLTFTRRPLETNRKTSKWSVWNHDYGESLGEISWYGPWWQYCFHAANPLIFSEGCLMDIARMIQRLSEERGASASSGLAASCPAPTSARASSTCL